MMTDLQPNPGDLEHLREMAEEGYGEFEDFYPRSAAGEMNVEQANLFYGRNVIWRGFDGQMVRVDPEYATAITGNIFDADKLAAIVSGIDEAAERVVFDAPFGQMSRVDLDMVKESIEYQDDPIYTTGDDELDRYLMDPEEVLSEYADKDDEPEEYVAQKQAFEAQMVEAVDDGDGDLGSWVASIRDGNHRAFGAMIAGEPYIYMTLYDNDFQSLKEGIADGSASEEDRELWDMLL